MVSYDPLVDSPRFAMAPAADFFGHQDPMVMEAAYSMAAPVNGPNFCPDDGGNDARYPVCRPVSALCAGHQE
jgi:hypothetical protein